MDRDPGLFQQGPVDFAGVRSGMIRNVTVNKRLSFFSQLVRGFGPGLLMNKRAQAFFFKSILYDVIALPG